MIVLATDTFVRANGAIGSNWTRSGDGGSQLVIVSDSVENDTAGASNARYFYNAVSAPNDQQSSVIFLGGSSSAGVGPTVRHSGSVGSDNLYGVFTSGIGSGASVSLSKWLSGTPTILATTTGLTLTSGDTITLKAKGTTLSWYQNGTLLGSITDASISSGQWGSLAYVTSGVSTQAAFGTWVGSDTSGIELVQDWGSTVIVSGTNSASGAFSSNVTSGSLMLVTVAVQTASVPTLAVSDGVNAFTQLAYASYTSSFAGAIALFGLIAPSTYSPTLSLTVSGTASGGTFGGLFGSNFSSAPISIDVGATASGNSQTPAVAASATSSSSELWLCGFVSSETMAGLTNPPAGSGTWIDMMNSPTSAFGISAYQITSGTGTPSANIGAMSAGAAWAATIVTLQTPVSTASNQRLMMMGTG